MAVGVPIDLHFYSGGHGKTPTREAGHFNPARTLPGERHFLRLQPPVEVQLVILVDYELVFSVSY